MTALTFKSLAFSAHRNFPDGVQAMAFFPNGYGVSVVRNRYSYGGEEGLYELAVFAGDEKRHSITYDTPVTDDVLGHLTPRQVTQIMKTVAALPARQAVVQ